ncbi:MAG: DNA cytosine methyltransferase [Capnocytophaga sp.]|nr:DNA cytosine methyltransferase [Capnocytophaga sp.]
MKYHYNWKLSETKFTKDKGTVFSCFACGGGSTMGYKLAGFDVVGFNEIDPKMAYCYVKNHQPKYQFIEPVQDFVKWDEYPQELYGLDILDGSPPCSSFSMAGNREDDWGKQRQFREGQAKQVLDTLFFDFIALAEKLQPKIVVAENVKGILAGAARKYVRRIISDFDRAGYAVREFVLNASDMGVPQRRERVFFIAIRKDLAALLPKPQGVLFADFPKLDMRFRQPKIPFSEIKTNENGHNWTAHDDYVWQHRRYGDKKYADILERLENRHSNFNCSFIYGNETPPTLVSSDASKYVLFDEPRRMNTTEMKLCQSFPLDYDFGSEKATHVQYMLGMSVPPVMMANIAHRIYEEWKIIFNH